MTAAEVDPDRVTAELERRFPGTSAWLGRFTGSWWALTRDRKGRSHLVEAATPAALAYRLNDLGVRCADAPPAPRYSRARLAAAPDATVPDLPRVASSPARPSQQRRHRAPRRGWLRTALGGLVAS